MSPPLRVQPVDAGRSGKVSEYHVAFARLGPLISLRTFLQGGAWWRLVVDPKTLKTSVVADVGAVSLALDQVEPSPWTEGLAEARQHDASLQDSGLTHLLPSQTGFVLTVDLCPSRKHFDFDLVHQLIAAVESSERPIPVAFAISGVWLQEHPDDLAQLQKLDGTDLAITWINHSMHHRYSPTRPLTQNFLLEPGTNMPSEVLDTEVVMLEAGLMPSVFFRFPGLISEPSLVEFVTSFGLIPVGSDAWLAKGERAGRGSIVLVHGNGNEPQGVKDFYALLKREGKAIAQHQFMLLDLREAVSVGLP